MRLIPRDVIEAANSDGAEAPSQTDTPSTKPSCVRQTLPKIVVQASTTLTLPFRPGMPEAPNQQVTDSDEPPHLISDPGQEERKKAGLEYMRAKHAARDRKAKKIQG